MLNQNRNLAILLKKLPASTCGWINPYLSVLILLSFSAATDSKGDDLPQLPDGFTVDVVAREPMVSNPCVMAFDRQGRICVAQGPQWRAPEPNTPGDRIDILLDRDGDGIADGIKTFAEGFNSVQGIAWYGDDLWVANSPDLTVVRDTDGDDQADVYIKIYTGLGNLEHSLHGLNFGPDGKLYMSKGNSKGYNRLDQLAPKAFRELWGLQSPKGAPDYTPVQVDSKETYQRAYHTPQDDWGQQGGILRCDPYGPGDDIDEMGKNLEIVSRGFRNPWDICFDSEFNWLGTDNDQTEGDKVYAPFFGAHYGWGHPWSFHWKGIGHLPTVPISMPLYEGSGAGVIHYQSNHFPPEYQGMFFVNDWMRREVYLFKPEWKGAHLRHTGGASPPVFAHAEGGRSLPSSSGRVFDPTDIEVGPDGALYILSWGHGYGGTIEKGKQIDAGRVYRIRHTTRPLQNWDSWLAAKSLAERSCEDLLRAMGSSIPAWRVNAQRELLTRGEESIAFLEDALAGELTTSEQTWASWTLGRLSPERLLKLVSTRLDDFNLHQQALRVIAQQRPSLLDDLLQWDSSNARLRHETIQAVWQSQRKDLTTPLIDALARESDRIVFYSAWNAMADLLSVTELKTHLSDRRAKVRLGALLGLFLTDSLAPSEVIPFRTDASPEVAKLVEHWLEKTGNGKPLITLTPEPGSYQQAVVVEVRSNLPRSTIKYTRDGSVPAMTSESVNGPITLENDTQLRFGVFKNRVQAGATIDADYKIRRGRKYTHRKFIAELNSDSGLRYEMDWAGLQVGKRHYTDRNYRIRQIPPELIGLPFIRTANQDDRRLADRLVAFQSNEPVEVLLAVDSRNPETLKWMNVGQPSGFVDTGLQLTTDDPVFKIYSKTFPPGVISLGPNINRAKDSRRGNYIVIFRREILKAPMNNQKVTVESVLEAMPNAVAERGREIFLHPQGAGCFKCHQFDGVGQVLGPDLSDIGDRAKDPKVLIESILLPSKVITEGFAVQKVLTTDGRILSGAVIEETGRSLKLADSEGNLTLVSKDEIEERIGTKVSPMPQGFGEMMNAQQVADLTAWLMTQKRVGDLSGFWLKDTEDSLEIHLRKQKIATYLKRHDQLTRRALVNVTTPSGIQVTRNFPPRLPEDLDPGYKGEAGMIHPVMHPGIWLGFGDVSGNDYWRLQSRVAFNGYHQPPEADRNHASFTAINRFLDKGEQTEVCQELTHYRFEIIPQGLLILIHAQYSSDQHDFYFGDQEESGLAVRVASPLRVQGGEGTIVNSHGDLNGAKVWGKEADWFDYHGTIEGRQVGVMVVPGTQNRRDSWLHARDYGVVVTNPFPKQPRERREPFIKTPVAKNESFKLSYGVVIHELPEGQPLDRKEIHQHVVARLNQGL
ncbi:MAG: PVC-type heme-binding CxxCH protein [Rubripirellula sp.]